MIIPSCTSACFYVFFVSTIFRERRPSWYDPGRNSHHLNSAVGCCLMNALGLQELQVAGACGSEICKHAFSTPQAYRCTTSSCKRWCSFCSPATIIQSNSNSKKKWSSIQQLPSGNQTCGKTTIYRWYSHEILFDMRLFLDFLFKNLCHLRAARCPPECRGSPRRPRPEDINFHAR